MKILLTNNSLAFYTGTETWVYAVVKELIRLGHEVTVLTLGLGKMSQEVAKFAKVITKYEGNYDCAIVNHRTTYELLPKELPKVFTCHSGSIPIEQPPKDCPTVYVNETLGSPVIRNGVDLERFYYAPTNEKLKTILYLSNPNYRGGEQFIREACEGYEVITIEQETFKTEDLIHKADLVISLARGAIEALACGRNVIYGDWRRDWMSEFKCSGMITEETYTDFKTGKMRQSLAPWSVERLRQELQMYEQKRGVWLREQAEKDFSITQTVQQYLWMFTNNAT